MDYVYCLMHSGTPVIRPMKNVTAVAGEELVLRCYVSGYPVHSITWKKGQRSVIVCLNNSTVTFLIIAPYKYSYFLT